jgi:3-hydroxyisobutyrate dehydrogenase-like beta-hydroxyacid dehydrogenase
LTGRDAGSHRLALAAARHADVDLRVVQAVAEEFERALDLGHGDDDFAAVYFAVKPLTRVHAVP